MNGVALEAVHGFTKRGDKLGIEPCVPDDLPELEIEYLYGRSVYLIVVRCPANVRRRGADVTLDGRALGGPSIPLVDDGERHVVVVRALGSGVPER